MQSGTDSGCRRLLIGAQLSPNRPSPPHAGDLAFGQWLATEITADAVERYREQPVKTAVLTPDSRPRLRGVNLHFHDLRREAGSRRGDAGWLKSSIAPLRTVSAERHS